MIFDGTLQEKLQKHQEDKEKEEMLVEEVEAALDNDYYSANCHSVETLEKLLKQLEELEKSIPDGFDNLEKKSYLLKLQTGLLNAITTQRMTKKYGVTTAKKIMAGKYEIGMSKAIVKEIIGANIFYYKESITTMAGKKTEIWEFDYDAEVLRLFTWEVKNILKAKCPTFVFRDGKLTDIIR